MRIKAGVEVAGLRPEALLAVLIASEVYRDYGEELVITSVVEGQHRRGSLHYVGQAVDFRLPRKAAASVIASTLANRLGADYDVILEPTHIHVEFQPK